MAEKKYGGVERLREYLNKTITMNKDPLEIILDMAKIIGEISGEEKFYRNIQEQIATTYGKVFENKFVLENEIKIVSERLKKIEAAAESKDFDEDEHRRIIFALERHKKEIERLQALKDNAKTSQS